MKKNRLRFSKTAIISSRAIFVALNQGFSTGLRFDIEKGNDRGSGGEDLP